MPLPLAVYVVGSALAGAFGFSVWEKSHQKKLAEDAARQNVFNQSAKQLDKGRSYTVQLMVDPRHPQWGGVKDLSTASRLIQATFEQLGWKFLMPATPREDAKVAAAKLQAAQPLEFIFNGTWMKDAKVQTGTPGWVGMAIPYPLPTA